MNKPKRKIKLVFINGLKRIVLKEINQYPAFCIIKKGIDFIHLDFTQNFNQITHLKSVLRVHIIVQNPKYNPRYIANHKLVLGSLIDVVLKNQKNKFKTFGIICAGSNSPNIRSISKYVQDKYKLTEEQEKADLKIHIIKTNNIWEVGVQITPRPLSLRNYKIRNISGAMNPTIAYAVNSLCKPEKANSYLNICSGSATLLIEAAQCFPNLKQLVGFDNNKKTISLAIQNIRKAGLIKRIQLKEKDIFNKPELGRFDIITSDLPFGMSISKNKNLEKLYQYFIEYCQEILNYDGRLAIYISDHEMLKEIISKSKFKIIKTVKLKFLTSVNAYLRPKIFICKLKQN